MDLSRKGTATGRILLAEDDEAIRRTLLAVLKSKGYDVDTAETAGQTVKLLQPGDYDLLIADYVMPGGGGEKIMAQAMQLEPKPAVIIITGLTDEKLFAELTAQGANRCLAKPFRLTVLLDVVAELLEARAAGVAEGNQA